MAKSTKQLARELGLLRKRPLANTSPRVSRKKQKTNQIFSHLIVIDFESTCWENERHSPQEIIEFPAVLLNVTTGQIESEFHHYLQPSERPTLSEFCHQLTGITQSQVDNGIPLSFCLRKFTAWLRKLRDDKGIVCADDKAVGNTDTSGTKMAAFVTWSDWDLGVCLFYEAKRKQITRPAALDRWIDLRQVYRKLYSRRPDGLNGALKDLGIQFDGREHSGLDDARNTAHLAWRMICDGCQMAITKTLKTKPSGKAERTSIPTVAQSLTGIKPMMNETVTSKPSVSSKKSGFSPKKPLVSPRGKIVCIDKSKTPSHEGTSLSNFNKRTAFSIPEDKNPSPEIIIKENPLPLRPGLSERNLNVGRPRQNLQSVSKTMKVSNNVSTRCPHCKLETKQFSPSKIPVLKPCWSTNSTRVNGCSLQTNQTEDKVGQPLNYAPSSIAGNVTTTNSNSFTNLRKESFKTPSGIVSTSKSPRVTSTNTYPKSSHPGVQQSPLSSVSPSSSHSFKTPTNIYDYMCNNKVQTSSTLSTNKTPVTSLRTSHNFKPNSSNMKITTPLCTCGRRSRRRLVQNQGPNIGRWFFSCSRGMQASGDGEKSGCGFFQWESPSSDRVVNARNEARKPFTPLFHPSSSSQRSLGIRNMSRIK